MGNSRLCKYNLRGGAAFTDRDGVATFAELAFDKGLPGVYRLQFFAAEACVL